MIIDTTLREGSQLFNTYFSNKEKQNIITSLAYSGVEEIEAGWTGMNNISDVLKWSGPKVENSTISIWAPCRENDIIRAYDYGVKRINIGVPSSPEHISKRLGINNNDLLKKVSMVVRLSSLMGLEVSVGLEDVYGADFDFLLKMIKTIESAGGFRVRFSDTRGLMSPTLVNELLSYFSKETDLKIAVHFHNDFGMATANSVTALESGADYTDASILGIGERAGITPLEEIAARLTFVEKKKSYGMVILRALCKKISELTDVSISRTKAVAGSDIFSCESGIHIHAISKDPSLMEPYSPELIGEKRKTAIGEKSGKYAIKLFFENMGIDTDNFDMNTLTENIRNYSSINKKSFTDKDLSLLTDNVLETHYYSSF